MKLAVPPPIIVRRMRVGSSGPLGAAWHSGSKVTTAFYNALSSSFPVAERFFIDSVAFFSESLPPPLAAQARAFIAQEANHAREHAAFNRRLQDNSVDLSEFESELARTYARLRNYDHITQIGVTAAFEHLTATLAHAMLTDPRHLAGVPPDLRRLWLWHAAEEIEHKAVAYDIFRWSTRDLGPWEVWKMRCRFGVRTTLAFVIGRWQVTRELLAQTGNDTTGNRLRLLVLLFISPGLLRQCLLPWLAFLLPRFHPWQVDDRRLLVSIDAGRWDRN